MIGTNPHLVSMAGITFGAKATISMLAFPNLEDRLLKGDRKESLSFSLCLMTPPRCTLQTSTAAALHHLLREATLQPQTSVP